MYDWSVLSWAWCFYVQFAFSNWHKCSSRTWRLQLWLVEHSWTENGDVFRSKLKCQFQSWQIWRRTPEIRSNSFRGLLSYCMHWYLAASIQIVWCLCTISTLSYLQMLEASLAWLMRIWKCYIMEYKQLPASLASLACRVSFGFLRYTQDSWQDHKYQTQLLPASLEQASMYWNLNYIVQVFRMPCFISHNITNTETSVSFEVPLST